MRRYYHLVPLIIFPGILLFILSLSSIIFPCILPGMDTMKDDKETGRLEAFSDGVFAVAITLLILNIQLPTKSFAKDEDLFFTYLLNLWPAYLAFVASFATIGIMWINHHRLFTYIKRTDTILIDRKSVV